MSKSPPQKVLAALKSGDPNVWAAARESMDKPALGALDLAGAMLADFDLSHCDLTNADLSEADLTGAALEGVGLDGADLTAAKVLEIEVSDASFAGASLDEAQVQGVFIECDFSSSTWTDTAARGSKFVKCNFTDAEIDLAALSRANRFERCDFGDRDDVPDSLRATRPEFLEPPLLEGERVVVEKLELKFENEAELKREAIGAATGAGWDAQMVGIFKDGAKIYIGLRPEEEVDLLEEWLAFERGEKGVRAVEICLDPGFETFLEELVIPMFEAGHGDLKLRIEQDLESGGAAVTELVIEGGKAQPPTQYKRT